MTASVPKLPHIIFFGLSGLLLLVTAWLLTVYDTMPPNPVLRIARHAINLEVADTPTEREIGLSGRKFIADNQGMLFTFEQPGTYCFWMKDTLVPLDIIWLDVSRRVTDVKYNAQPGSYPESYCPDEPASSVIELSAGMVERHLIAPGQVLDY